MKKKSHGGKRKGSGRKPKEPTKVIRVSISKVPAIMISEEEYKKRCAEILRDNIIFSGQIGDYVIHGALAKLWKLHTGQ